MNKKKLKLTKETIVLLILSLLLVVSPIVYYFIIKSDEGEVLSWYSSSWNYKRAITVGNTTGSTLTNEDVVVTLDTSTMISQNKLQSDCGDLRFIDSDDSTVLNYWIEGGCNTSTTEVWVRIPSLPAGGKTIYVYYNNPSASNGQLSWSGSYLVMSNQTSCPTGWSEYTSINDKFPRGYTSSGGTGGASSHTHILNDIPSHSHGDGSYACASAGNHNHSIRTVGYITGSYPYPYYGTQNKGGAWYNAAIAYAGDHSHSISGETASAGVSSPTTNSVSNMPSYYTLNLCTATASNVSVTPANFIYLFDPADGYPTTNFTRFASMDSRFPYIRASSYLNQTGGGTSHSHTYSSIKSHTHTGGSMVTNTTGSHKHYAYMWSASGYGSTYLQGEQYGGSWYSTACAYSGAHTHDVTGTSATVGSASGSTSSNSHLPPYRNMIFNKQDANGTAFLSTTIIMMQTAIPPLGWTRYSDLDSRFPRGATSSGTGGASTHTHTYSTVISHSHGDGTLVCASAGSHRHSLQSGSGGAEYPYLQMGDTAGNWTSGVTSTTGAHTHTISGSTGTTGTASPVSESASNIPPYMNLLFAKRNQSQSTSVGAEQEYNNTPTAPTSLLTEGQTNPNNITDTTPEFSAIYNDPDTSDTSSYYEIEVNTSSDFTGTVMWDTDKTSMTTTNQGSRSPDISYTGSTLNYNQTYYWRIKFWDALDAESPWSSTANFKINRSPTQPTSLLTEGQTNPNNITDFTPELSAIYNDPDTTDTSSYYEIEVNTSSDFTGTVMWDSGQTSMTATSAGSRSPDISYAGTTLSANTTYYWRIKFWDSVNQVSPWSTIANFKINRTPTAPTNLLTEGEINPTAIKGTTPEFSAIYNDPDTTDTSSYYEIEVNTASDFTGTVMWDSGKTSMTTTNEGNRSPDISYAGDALSTETTYYWRIKFWDSVDNEGTWSDTANFKIDIVPTATDLLIIGETNPTQIPYDIYFSAIYTDPNLDDSSAYQIQVNTNNTFDGTIMWDSTKTSATISSGNRSSNIYYEGTDLEYNGTTYYVRMKFWDIDDNASNWVTGQFTDTLKSFQFNGLQMNGIQLN